MPSSVRQRSARPIRRGVVATCPECDAVFRGGAPGAVVPCPACGNPVVVPESKPKRVEKKTAREPVDAAPAAPPPMPWGLAIVVLVVLAVAHYGLYLLITAGARTELADIESRQGSKVHRHVLNPGDAPPASSPKYREWHEQKELYDDVRAYEEHEAQRAWVARGLGLAYLVQLGITGWALYRIATKRASSTRRATSRKGRA